MNSKNSKRQKRKRSIRKKIKGNSIVPRLSVFRSNRYFYAQAIDDVVSKTLAAVKSGDLKSQSIENAAEFLSNELTKQNIKKLVFDRNGYKYHGKIKNFADNLRKNGITI